MVGLEWYLCCRLKPATWIPLQPNHTETHRFNNVDIKCKYETKCLGLHLTEDTKWDTHIKDLSSTFRDCIT